MKRILATLSIIGLSLMMTQISMAQDIIHTYDSAPIKAKILEIGDDYMYYKTWDNPDGPLYNMSLSRVMKIVFENGSTKVFAPVSPYMGSGRYGAHPMDYRWGHYYSPYGRLSQGQIADYIGYSLYGSDYMKAKDRYLWGMSLTCAGISGVIMTIATHLALVRRDEFLSHNGMGGSGGYGAGIAAGYLASAGCIGAGIPLWVKGNKGLKKIADDYNRTYVNPERSGHSPNLSLGATDSGIGLALNF